MDLAEYKGIYVIAEQFETYLSNCWVRPAFWLTPSVTKLALS